MFDQQEAHRLPDLGGFQGFQRNALIKGGTNVMQSFAEKPVQRQKSYDFSPVTYHQPPPPNQAIQQKYTSRAKDLLYFEDNLEKELKNMNIRKHEHLSPMQKERLDRFEKESGYQPGAYIRKSN